MSDVDLDDELRAGTRAAWHRYLDVVAPFRPELHRYCLGLCGNLWDAEDLVQDALLRGFGTLGAVHQRIANPRGYLVRIATNLWIDRARRRSVESEALARASAEPAEGPAPAPGSAHDAGAVLLQRLSPQERAAVVLKDSFDLSLEEVAQMLQTTVGAVKAALHGGRSRLRAAGGEPDRERPRPSAALVDRFVALLNASDLPGLLALMLDGASVEMLGSLVETGRAEFEHEGSWLWQAVHVHPDWPAGVRPPKFENERAVLDGEPLVLSFLPIAGRRSLMSVTRFEEREGRIARILAYNFCPETVRAVAERLDLPAGPLLYRFPTPAPGRYFGDGSATA